MYSTSMMTVLLPLSAGLMIICLFDCNCPMACLSAFVRLSDLSDGSW